MLRAIDVRLVREGHLQEAAEARGSGWLREARQRPRLHRIFARGIAQNDGAVWILGDPRLHREDELPQLWGQHHFAVAVIPARERIERTFVEVAHGFRVALTELSVRAPIVNLRILDVHFGPSLMGQELKRKAWQFQMIFG